MSRQDGPSPPPPCPPLHTRDCTHVVPDGSVPPQLLVAQYAIGHDKWEKGEIGQARLVQATGKNGG